VPLYDYRCSVCGQVREVEAPMGHEAPACDSGDPFCGGLPMQRLYTRPPRIPPSRVQA
jgi:putative FmdB family regulatory protein